MPAASSVGKNSSGFSELDHKGNKRCTLRADVGPSEAACDRPTGRTAIDTRQPPDMFVLGSVERQHYACKGQCAKLSEAPSRTCSQMARGRHNDSRIWMPTWSIARHPTNKLKKLLKRTWMCCWAARPTDSESWTKRSWKRRRRPSRPREPAATAARASIRRVNAPGDGEGVEAGANVSNHGCWGCRLSWRSHWSATSWASGNGRTPNTTVRTKEVKI